MEPWLAKLGDGSRSLKDCRVYCETKNSLCLSLVYTHMVGLLPSLIIIFRYSCVGYEEQTGSCGRLILLYSA
eukprot:g63684.t1